MCYQNPDYANLPVERETADLADDDSGETLDDGIEGDTHQTVHFLRIVAERGGELASVLLAFVKELDILAEDSTNQGARSWDASSSDANLHIRWMYVLPDLQHALAIFVRRESVLLFLSVDCVVLGQSVRGSSLRKDMRVHIAWGWQPSTGWAKTLKTRLSSLRGAFEICSVNVRFLPPISLCPPLLSLSCSFAQRPLHGAKCRRGGEGHSQARIEATAKPKIPGVVEEEKTVRCLAIMPIFYPQCCTIRLEGVLQSDPPHAVFSTDGVIDGFLYVFPPSLPEQLRFIT